MKFHMLISDAVNFINNISNSNNETDLGSFVPPKVVDTDILLVR